MSDNLPFVLCPGDFLRITQSNNFTGMTESYRECYQKLTPDISLLVETDMCCVIQQVDSPYGQIRIRITDKPPEKPWTYDDVPSNPYAISYGSY